MANFFLLAVLGGVVLALLFLFSRTRRQELKSSADDQPAPSVVIAALPTILPGPISKEPAKITPVKSLPMLYQLPEPPRPVIAAKVKKKRPKAPKPKGKTAVRDVLKMLKEPGSLASAFVLREILDRPIARRVSKGK